MPPYDSTRDALYHPEYGAPIAPDPTKKDLREAEYARLSYIRFETGPEALTRLTDALVAWGTVQRFTTFSDPGTGAQAFSVQQGKTYVAFRGTEPDNISDIGTDLEATLIAWPDSPTPLAQVHEGFFEQFHSVWTRIEDWLDGVPPAEVTFVGHSLGAALATLAVARLSGSTAVTIGSPRVGNDGFCSLIAPERLTRYVDCCDVVTVLPPAIPFPGGPYVHAGTELYIDRNGVMRPGWSESQIDSDKETARAEYLVSTAWKLGSVPVRDLADHAAINYVRALM